jgi:hypothetical protein
MNNNETPNTSLETLKHVLCGALTHIDAISTEIKKLNIKEKPEDNDPEAYKRAKLLHLTLIAINDIIHPAHTLLPELFKGNEDYFGYLVSAFAKAKSDGLSFKGCMCDGCSVKAA